MRYPGRGAHRCGMKSAKPQPEIALGPTSSQYATALDRTLTDLVNLGLLARQARWNLVGPGFYGLQQVLGTLADRAGTAADAVAERAVSVGHHPDVRAEVVARGNVLPVIAPGPVRDTEATAALSTALNTVVTRLRDAMNAVADDLVTGDLLIEITRDLEHLAWVIRAHRQ